MSRETMGELHYMEHEEKLFVFLFLIISCIAIISLIFALLHYFNMNKKNVMINEIERTFYEQQKEYYQRMLEKEDETRKFRHDSINHLLCMQSYCQNQNYESVKKYIDELLDSITDTTVTKYDVGNDIVNTIINFYFVPLEGICDVKVKGYMGDLKGVTQVELCAVVSNLVKNAVEAAEKCKMDEKYIYFGVHQGNKYIKFIVRNSIQFFVEFGKCGLPLSIKEDKKNHGLGLKNVLNIVKRRNGEYSNTMVRDGYETIVTLKV